MRSDYASLESDYSVLKEKTSRLEKSYDELAEEYSNLRGKYAELESNYTALSWDYKVLSSDYESLKGVHDELIAALEKGEAVAESATWLSEDKRLKVTSELIPEYMWGEIWSYDVKVTVTNVGDEPLDKVWIFIFPYVDGKLDFSTWECIHSIENLYIGESYSYTFTYLPAEMTTYEVLVVGS